MKVSLPLMKNLLTLLARSALLPLGLIAAASVTDANIQKKIFGLGTTLIFLNEDLNEIKKIIKSFEDSGLLIEDVTETV